jgi:hypothetical protein
MTTALLFDQFGMWIRDCAVPYPVDEIAGMERTSVAIDILTAPAPLVPSPEDRPFNRISYRRFGQVPFGWPIEAWLYVDDRHRVRFPPTIAELLWRRAVAHVVDGLRSAARVDPKRASEIEFLGAH